MASSRPAWGNVLLCALLLVLLGGLGVWHATESSWTSPGISRWLAAGGVAASWLLLTLFIAWRRRVVRASLPSTFDENELLIAFASQTGTAAQLAAQSASSLANAGMRVQLAELGELDGAMLARRRRVLFIVSTTGEGDAPDSAASFVARCMREPQALASLEYGLLGLGDRDYANFCGFARQLEHWLHQSGAQPWFDAVDVDNNDPAALRHWQHHLALVSGAADMPDWERPEYQRWRLVERRLLNPQSVGDPCFHLALQPLDGEPAWQAGDLVEVGPQHAPDTVEQWLGEAGLPGDVPVTHQQRTLALRDWLAGSQRMPPQMGQGIDLLALVQSLTPLPHREYSIASIPADGSLHLLVRRMRRDDGSLGLGSGWLTAHARVGDIIALRIRSNPAFHAPRADVPLVLIGNGTGLAGLRALLKARVAVGASRHWLLFGERQSAHDFHHGDDIRAWQQQGYLERLDLAWSRDGADKVYVQDRLRDAGPTLKAWVAEGAAIYVCGSLQGMAPGVDAVLRDVLGDDQVEQLREQGRYRRDVY